VMSESPHGAIAIFAREENEQQASNRKGNALNWRRFCELASAPRHDRARDVIAVSLPTIYQYILYTKMWRKAFVVVIYGMPL
jgi:hypothetical protein